MAIFKINDKYVKPVTLGVTGLYLCMAVLFFIPAVEIPCKVCLPLLALAVASLWLCPWQIAAAMFMSFLGDLTGACDMFLAQMGCFAMAHIFLIWFFILRYKRKVEHDGKMTGKAIGYTFLVLWLCAFVAGFAFAKVVLEVPEGVMRTGTGAYTLLICSMLMMALLQRSSLYALGAVLFVFSDLILAWNKFIEPIPYAGLLILCPYYMAQWLLFVRATPYRIRSRIKLMRF